MIAQASQLVVFARDFVLVVAVQLFMLLHVGFFYFWNRYRTPKTRSLVAAPKKEALDSVISILVPVLNEEDGVEPMLRQLASAAEDPSRLEVIICDSGCTDGTMAIVDRFAASPADLGGLKVTATKPEGGGRGGAIATGLDKCAGSPGAVIFFLHADCEVPPRFDSLLRAALAKPGVLMTAFSFRTSRAGIPAGQAKPAGLDFMEWTVNVRSGLYQLPFGDQALAITRETLAVAGGLPELPMLEDYELVQRLRKMSAEGAGRIVTLPEPALCSVRRWLKRPIWRVNWVNQMSMIRYNFFGATAEDIYRYYYGRAAPAPRLKAGGAAAAAAID